MVGLQVIDFVPRPLKIYYDNSIAILFLAKNNKSGSQSKRINIKYLAMREHVKENGIIIENISTGLMIADPLTKGMQTKSFNNYVKSMGLDFVI
ncbi:Copia protein [Glycine soja]